MVYNFERAHKKLEVYKLSIELVKDIYEFTSTLPNDEKFGLISQLKRASVSVPANIAEGAARNTKKEFVNFLYISQGSLSEIDTLIDLCISLNISRHGIPETVNQKISKLSAMLNKLIKSIKLEIDKQPA